MANKLPKSLPLLQLQKTVVIPNTIHEFAIGNASTMNLIKLAIERNDGYFAIENPSKIKAKEEIVKKVVLVKFLRLDETTSRPKVLVEALNKITFQLDDLKINDALNIITKYTVAKTVRGASQPIEEGREVITKVLLEKGALPFEISNVEVEQLAEKTDEEFIDIIANLLPLSLNEKVNYMDSVKLVDKYLYIMDCLTRILEGEADPMQDTKDGVNKRVKDKITKQQREFYLREQLKATQAELDELNGEVNEFDSYRKKVESNPYPQHIKDKVLSEVRKLEQTPSQAQEANITRSYIEWLLELPYWQKDIEKLDINEAKKILDRDHYGLEKPKSKIIEFLAVKQQNPDAKGSILALVGPPGTGKTTMAKSIADALGRKLIKISLGGVKDEAEIRGHRRTYIASQPGKIIAGMKKAGVNNPIILLDEIDKMSADYKGDPSSAMLEVLDYEQNSMFQDHYIEEDYDLSNVTFIATANYYENIPEALIDRLDFIEVSSYTELEKMEIFKNHLLPKIINETKIPKSIFKWTDSAIKELIRHYTIEAGVRQLHREANTIARKILVKKLNGELKGALTIKPETIQELLGPQKFDYTKIDKKPQVGAVTGLAWTQYGGDILPIEINLYPGKGEVIITGQLKDVMRESATIALSYIKANADKFGVKDLDKINEMNIHIHSPDGATPKDGPSAGVTFTTAMISALTGKSVSQFIGMTGEISLRGHVLPIGGLKEKSISAYRSGLKTIFIPKENIKDLIDIPQEVKDNLEIIPVERYSEIFDRIFKK